MSLWQHSDRRVGERRAAAPWEVLFSAQLTVRAGMLRSRTETVRVIVRLLDVSVSGASIEVPTIDGLAEGQRAELAFAEDRAAVVVRRSQPGAAQGMTRYGLQFVDLEPAVRRRLFELVSEWAAAGGTQHVWRNAR